jgi:hypothetical protein
LSAEDLPVRRSATTSNETFCPSLRLCIPARSTALMCTNTSWPPSSGWMKPKPFWPLNHFTVPCVMRHFFQIGVWVGRAFARPVHWSRIRRKSSVRRKARGEAKSFGRNSIYPCNASARLPQESAARKMPAKAKGSQFGAQTPMLGEASAGPADGRETGELPASNRKVAVTRTHSIGIAPEIEPRWEPRLHAEPRAAHNDNHAGDGLCPICGGYASIGLFAGECCGNGIIRRHWICRACGHEWDTVLRVLS